MPTSRAILCSVVATCLAATAHGQTQWNDVSFPVPSGEGHAMVYDALRDRVVLVGDGETWTWDGSTWSLQVLTVQPAWRLRHAMVYDAARGVVVLFGGFALGVSHYGDTWEWDGATWTQRTPATVPPTRSEHGMAYDSARQRVVMFGGTGTVFGILADTWEWDGADWQLQTPAAAPAARKGHAMAFDPGRGRTVMFGGLAGSALNNETWEWDGVNWSLAAPPNSPSARTDHAMAFDYSSGAIVMFAGYRNTGLTVDCERDLWRWDGVDWQQLACTAMPLARTDHAMTCDPSRGRVVLFGGLPGAQSIAPFSDTWQWTVAGWQPLGEHQVTPRWGHAMARDETRGEFVLFGGTHPVSLVGNRVLVEVYLDDTVVWDGTGGWKYRGLGFGPSAREGHQVAANPSGGIVLFGGQDATQRFGDTWLWDGQQWTGARPTSAPSPRSWHAAAYDPDRNVVVLFGGWTGAPDSETWEWDGASWQQRLPVNQPPGRYFSAMTYDAERQVMVMFGGDGGPANLRDTWEWDGVDWTLRLPLVSPPTVREHALAYDPVRRAVVMSPGPTWEWDGINWSKRTITGYPTRRDTASLEYDPVGRRLVHVGGADFSTDSFFEINEGTQEYVTIAVGTYIPFGTSCAGAAGTPVLGAVPFQRPWVNETFILQVDGLPVGAPAAVAFGNSNTASGAVALPFDLAPFGAPGCTVASSMELAFSLSTNANGTAAIAVPIPFNPAFIGAVFYNQAIALDAAANPLGIVMSNAATATVGWRR